MKTANWATVTALMAAMGAGAGVAAENEPTPGQVTRVACDLAVKPNSVVIYKGTAEDTSTAKQTKDFHYDVYLPSDYGKDPTAFYPAMFIASPGGNASMGVMEKRLKNDGWIVIMLVESKNDIPEWLNSFLAAHDDAVKRFRIAPGAKFATGMSGGSRCASMYPVIRPGFHGVLLQAAGFASGFSHLEFTTRKNEIYSRYPAHVLIAATFGDKDSNLSETIAMRRLLPAGCLRHVEVFQGTHQWCPVEVFNRAMDWMEEKAFLQKPAVIAPCRLLGVEVKPEPMGPAAYQWFFRLTQARGEAAKTPAEKYRQLERLPVIARNGNLGAAPAVSATLAKTDPVLRELSLAPDVQELVRVRQAYGQVMQTFGKFEAALMRGAYEFGSMHLSPLELKEFETFLAESGKFVDKYADSPEADQLRCLNESVKLEFAGPGKKH